MDAAGVDRPIEFHGEPAEEPARVPDADGWLAELEHERRRGEQACKFGHARRQHVIGGGLDLCAVTLPGRQVCLCTLFRLDRGHQRGDA